jgi:hypothetical protein
LTNFGQGTGIIRVGNGDTPRNSPGRWLLSAIIDGCFLLLWAAIQWGTGWALYKIPLDGLDALIRDIFRGIFALASLVPVASHIYENSWKMIYRVRTGVKKAKKEFQRDA